MSRVEPRFRLLLVAAIALVLALAATPTVQAKPPPPPPLKQSSPFTPDPRHPAFRQNVTDPQRNATDRHQQQQDEPIQRPSVMPLPTPEPILQPANHTELIAHKGKPRHHHGHAEASLFDLRQVHPSMHVAAKLMQLVARNMTAGDVRPIDAPRNTDPYSFWYAWRFIPYVFFIIMAVSLVALFTLGKCDLHWFRGLTGRREGEDERISNVDPNQPLRVSLLRQTSSHEGVHEPLSNRWPISNIGATATGGLDAPSLYQSDTEPMYDSPESPYSPMHTHPYAAVSYQNPDARGNPLQPKNDLQTPATTTRTLGLRN